MNEPKILFFDIENTPLIGNAWGTYQTDLLRVIKDTELLSYAYAFNNDDVRVFSRRLFSERQLAKQLWKLFDEADIIVGHNGDQFDIKMCNQYFIKYGLKPPSPYSTVDTLKLAKKHFRFAQNKLDYLGKFLFKERKLPTNMDLWFRCMEGDENSLKEMEEYNIQDVVLLRKVYDSLKGWHTGHPNFNLYAGTSHKCPVCGGQTSQRRGFAVTRTQKYQRLQCKDCGAWHRGDRIPLIAKIIR